MLVNQNLIPNPSNVQSSSQDIYLSHHQGKLYLKELNVIGTSTIPLEFRPLLP